MREGERLCTHQFVLEERPAPPGSAQAAAVQWTSRLLAPSASYKEIIITESTSCLILKLLYIVNIFWNKIFLVKITQHR